MGTFSICKDFTGVFIAIYNKFPLSSKKLVLLFSYKLVQKRV